MRFVLFRTMITEDFLKEGWKVLKKEVKGGNFVNSAGEVLGQHEGYPFYTIGQRKGLGLAFGEPMYVTEIQADTNVVVLGKVDELLRNGMTGFSNQFNEISGDSGRNRNGYPNSL